MFLDPKVDNANWIKIIDTRPPAARQNFTDVSSVEKYQMPEEQYEQLTDSVLAWKKKQKLGRFDPSAKSSDELANERYSKDSNVIKQRNIKVNNRCRIGQDDGRRGIVRFVGLIEGLGGEREAGCIWIGVELDEPVGRNDGSVKVEIDHQKSEVKQVFQCKDKFGIFARPEKVEVGEWPPLDDLELDDDMEEI